jgi:hypothetical protein
MQPKRIARVYADYKSSFIYMFMKTVMQGKRWKKLFWVSAIAPLFSVIVSTVIVSQARLDKDGVATVRDITFVRFLT